MKILISGASGLIGRALSQALTSDGHQIVRLVRQRSAEPDAIFWKPSQRRLDPQSIEGFDVVVHLAGVNIGAKRWSAARKQAIRDSRVDGTRLLADSLAQLKLPPKLFLCASATGYYGDRGDAVLTEEAKRGEGFIAELVADWEAATAPAETSGIRTVTLRTGVVLSPEGGALKKMLPFFNLGIAGKLGSGRQYMSWIALPDMIAVMQFVIDHEGLSGPVNATSPHPVTNAEFTSAMGRVLHRPTMLPVPAFGLKILFGEMAQETVLSSARVVPEKLAQAGFAFQYPEIEAALRAVLI